jgi:hypothetical protein
MLRAFLAAAAISGCISASTAAAEPTPDEKKYSYLCLVSDENLCLGISTGDTDPFFDRDSIFYLQLKSRSKGEATNTDYRKLRW